MDTPLIVATRSLSLETIPASLLWATATKAVLKRW